MQEILVILVLALIFLGPKKLPELASGIGKAIREVRKATADIKSEIELDDVIRKLNGLLSDMDKANTKAKYETDIPSTAFGSLKFLESNELHSAHQDQKTRIEKIIKDLHQLIDDFGRQRVTGRRAAAFNCTTGPAGGDGKAGSATQLRARLVRASRALQTPPLLPGQVVLGACLRLLRRTFFGRRRLLFRRRILFRGRRLLFGSLLRRALSNWLVLAGGGLLRSLCRILTGGWRR